MSTRTSPRREAAIRQRRFLKNECGYDDREIELFARIFTQPDKREPRITCAIEEDPR